MKKDIFVDGIKRYQALKNAYQLRLLSVLGHQPTQERLARALDMIIKESIYSFIPASRENKYQWTVRNSGTSHQIEYIVDLTEKTCTCPDAEIGNLCKHRLAVELIVSAENIYLESIGESHVS